MRQYVKMRPIQFSSTFPHPLKTFPLTFDAEKRGIENRSISIVFQPGQSGNAGGRPKSDPVVAALARQNAPEAFSFLASVVGLAARTIERYTPSEAKQKIEEAPTKNECAVINSGVKAAEAILDRAYGKPPQSLKVGGDGEQPLEFGFASLRDALRAAHGLGARVPAGSNGNAGSNGVVRHEGESASPPAHPATG